MENELGTTQYIKLVKIKRDNNVVSGFDCVAEINPLIHQDNDHFFWLQYEDVGMEYEEDSVRKMKWSVVIDGKDFGLLDNMVLGSIYKEEVNSFLPSLILGEDSPFKETDYVFDFTSGKWVAPILEDNIIKIWDVSEQKHK